jgi:putative SOS response-associated peptidase YedK
MGCRPSSGLEVNRAHQCEPGRSEGRHFANSSRCLIPASAFFEFTGKKYPKAKHRFALRGSPITAIAGLWREAQGNHPPSFTMLTTAPGPDIAPYHNR